MRLLSIELEKFKRINKAKIMISDINVLIGSNNAGKSSVLQGIHFSVVAGVAARRLRKKTFTQDNLLYCPTRNFKILRNGSEYQNQSCFSYLRIRAEFDNENNETEDDLYTIRVYRARNEGNVGCERTGDVRIGSEITDDIPPFSIYVPGLAGIPQTEEYRSESVVRKGVASGDANLYLRNVIYLILKKGLLPELRKLMLLIFPRFWIDVKFDPIYDSYIDVLIKHKSSNVWKHIELVGTGVLQALQIFSYVTLFKPPLLLLDEPDSHLHPDNQVLLTDALITISQETNTKIILSTHSRHIVDSLYGDANFVWLKDGKVFEQGSDLHRISMLLDIGALDSYEKLREGDVEYVVLTEDAKMDLIKTLFKSSGFDLNEIIFYSYKASSNLTSAGALAEFIKEIATETKIIIHADNDFLTADEIENLKNKIIAYGALPFITEGSDIESYFINESHIAAVIDEDVNEVEEWINEIATQYHNQLTHKFSRKRDDAKWKLYKNENTPPDTIQLMGNDVPLTEENRLGKFMLKKIRSLLHEKFECSENLLSESDYLYSETLQNILEKQA